MLIRFGTCNIRNKKYGGLKSTLRGIGQANMDVGVFQETKLTDGIYTRGSAGYRVVAMSELIRQRGGVALLYWDSSTFVVEAIHQFGANFIACQMERGERRWYFVGFYLALGDGREIRDVDFH